MLAYKELIEAAQDTMRELIQKMEHQLCDNPVIEKQMRQLVQALETTTGKEAVWLSEETAQSIGGYHRGRAGPANGSGEMLRNLESDPGWS